MPGLRENIEKRLSREPEIDKELAALIPPLTPEEYSGLEQSILAEGCRDAIILWNNIIVDGHNRYRICKAHNIPYRTETKEFANREEVMLWMFQNQLSRRNLNDFQRIEIVRKWENAVKAEAKKRQEATRFGGGGKITTTVEEKSRDTLGAMAGVSGKTYEHAVEVLDKAPEAVTQAVRKNELSINAAYGVIQMPPDKQREVSERIEHGEKPKNAITNVKKKNSQSIVKPHKHLTALFTATEIEQVAILADVADTDIERMIVELVRQALRAEDKQRVIQEHRLQR